MLWLLGFLRSRAPAARLKGLESEKEAESCHHKIPDYWTSVVESVRELRHLVDGRKGDREPSEECANMSGEKGKEACEKDE